jgi:hypothetical protein
MMRLAAAWRNTSVSRLTGTACEPMMSASTCPQLASVGRLRRVREHPGNGALLLARG